MLLNCHPVPAHGDQLQPDTRMPDIGRFASPKSELVEEDSGKQAAGFNCRREGEDDRGEVGYDSTFLHAQCRPLQS